MVRKKTEMDKFLKLLFLDLFLLCSVSGQSFDDGCFTKMYSQLRTQLKVLHPLLCKSSSTNYKQLMAVIQAYNDASSGSVFSNCGGVLSDGKVSEYSENDALKAVTVLKSKEFAERINQAVACSSKRKETAGRYTRGLLLGYPRLLRQLEDAVHHALKSEKSLTLGSNAKNDKEKSASKPQCTVKHMRPTVRGGDALVLVMTCHSMSEIVSTKWTSILALGHTYIDLRQTTEEEYTDQLPNNEYKMVLGIREGVVKAGRKYTFSVDVSTIDGQLTRSEVTINVKPGLKGGQLKCPVSYTEHDKMTVYVTGMKSSLTLTYMLLVETVPGKYRALTEKQTSGEIDINGPRLFGKSGNVFRVEVCAENDPILCKMLTCKVHKVIPASPEVLALTKLRHDVEELRKEGKPLKACVLLGAFIEKTNDKSLTPLMLESAYQVVIDGQLDVKTASTFLDVLTTIPSEFLDKSEFLSAVKYIQSASSVLVRENTKIPEHYIAALDSWMARGEALGLSWQEIKGLGRSVETLQSSGMEPGDTHRFNLKNSHVTVLHNVPGDNVSVKSEDGHDIQIKFGESVREKVGHAAVKVRVNAYKQNPSVVGNVQSLPIAPVVAVTFWDPKTHTEKKIVNLKTHATIQLKIYNTHMGIGLQPQCVYWNSSHGHWMTDGVTTGALKGTTIECKTTHFTTYTVIHAYQAYNRDQNVGWIVGVVLGIIIAMIVIILLIILLFYCCKRNQIKDSSRSNSPLTRGNGNDGEKQDGRRTNDGNNQDGYVNEGSNWRQDVYHMEIRPGSGDGLKRGLP